MNKNGLGFLFWQVSSWWGALPYWAMGKMLMLTVFSFGLSSPYGYFSYYGDGYPYRYYNYGYPYGYYAYRRIMVTIIDILQTLLRTCISVQALPPLASAVVIDGLPAAAGNGPRLFLYM